MTETRAEAQRLVDEGRVRIIDPSPAYMIAQVDSLYETVLYPYGRFVRFVCSCTWGRRYSGTDDLCAHALAVKLAVEKENKT